LRRIGEVNEVIAEYTGQSYGADHTTETTLGRRWGTGKASITSIEITNASGKPVERIECGEGLTISVAFDSHAVIEDLVIFAKISTLTGTEVWSTSSRTNGIALPRIIGSGRVQLRLPTIPLLEGTYLLSIALRNGRETVEFDHWENGHKFDVHQSNLFDQGIIRIESKWTSD
jgi:hypothetical protein